MIWQALMRLLATLAVVSLALAPVTAPAVSASPAASASDVDHAVAPADPMGGMTAMAMDDMPCCPPDAPSAWPDCSKGCPLMALCLAKVVSGLPAAVGLPLRVAIAQTAVWDNGVPFTSLAQAPPPEPPRS